MVGNVFISEGVYSGILEGKIWKKYVEIKNDYALPVNNKETDHYKIIKGIIEGNTLREKVNVFDDKYLEIRKWTGKKYSDVSLVFEHIIPAKVYIDELIRAYKDKDFNQVYFQSFRNLISICIVTEDENKKLNKWHDDMPQLKGNDLSPKEKWNRVSQNPFARYDDPEVNVHIHFPR